MFVAAFLVAALGQLASVLSGIPVQSIADQLPFQVPTPLPTSVAAFSGTLGAWFTTEIFDEEGPATDYFAGVDAGFKSIYFGYTLTIFAIMVLTALIYTVFNVFVSGALGEPFVVLLAVVTGLFTLVPLVGRSIIYLCIAGVFAVQAASTVPTLLWYPLVFVQQIRPVLAHPDRQRPCLFTGHQCHAVRNSPCSRSRRVLYRSCHGTTKRHKCRTGNINYVGPSISL